VTRCLDALGDDGRGEDHIAVDEEQGVSGSDNRGRIPLRSSFGSR
jgi:hypothetical protein